jgi:HSP20 family protein
MATQESKKTDESQSQQKTQPQQGQPQQGQAQQTQTQTMTRGTQQSGTARRGGYDPLNLSLLPFPSPFSLLNPFSLIRRLTEEIANPSSQSGSGPATSETAWLPPIEVSERDGDLVIQAELPGQTPENVTVEVTNDAVIIEGERAIEQEENRGDVYRTECRYGRFYRSIPLPEGANVDQARARYDNGILEVRIPVAKPQSSSRQLPIEATK